MSLFLLRSLKHVFYLLIFYSGIWRKGWCAALLRIIPHYRGSTPTTSVEEPKPLPAPDLAETTPLEKETKMAAQRIMAFINEQKVRKTKILLYLDQISL
jgi:hypothetical protein